MPQANKSLRAVQQPVPRHGLDPADRSPTATDPLSNPHPRVDGLGRSPVSHWHHEWPHATPSHAQQRAVVARYVGHASTAARLRTEIIDTARAAEALGLAATTAVDGYVAVGEVDVLIGRHGLTRDDLRIALRATAMDLAVVADLAGADTVLGALDLAESLDVRERRAGLDGLSDALARFRG